MLWFVTLGFLAALLVFAFVVVKLNDRLQEHRSRMMKPVQLSSLPHDVEALETLFGRRMPNGLRSWREAPEAYKQPVQLPDPNGDLYLTEVLPLNPSAMSVLGWKRTSGYVPIAALRDGDLLVVKLDANERGETPVYAYFHDGGEFELLYKDISELSEAIRSRTRTAPEE